MPLPIRQLPVLQNWDCHACGTCCHEYEVTVTDEERRRIAGQGWESDASLAGTPVFVASGPPWAREYRLNHRADGACVFLSPEGRCRIHERFGAAAKPLACRLYPFVLVPADGHWRIGMRYSCPSASANRGRPAAEHRTELAEHASRLEENHGEAVRRTASPRLAGGQQVSWDDVMRFLAAVLREVRDQSRPLVRRLRRLLAMSELCRAARFDQITGARLGEFLDVVRDGLDEPTEPGVAEPPSRLGAVLFRQAAGVYLRRDRGPNRGLVRGRLALLRAGWRFATGSGRVPRVHAWVGDLPFTRGEEPAGTVPPAGAALLERYYATKIASLQFCGAGHFGFAFWDGIESLVLTYPVILWASRLVQGHGQPDAVTAAVAMVDHNYGHNPQLGTARHRLAVRTLARRGDLAKLVSWYSR